ncbi:MAG: CapA family protein [Alistipes sp.]|nr:CapA family protein [Alistipes sp.]
MKLLFCGDIMPGGVLPYQKEYMSDTVKEYLQSFDLVIGTLETAIGTDIPFDKVKIDGRQNIIYSRNEDFFRLIEMKVNVVSLANNHVFDMGIEGLANTIDILKKNNIKYCGAGKNIQEASEPLVLNVDNRKVVILAYCSDDPNQVGYVPIATQVTYGVNTFNIETAVEEVKRYKSLYDNVVVMMHWGREYSSFPIKQIKYESYKLVESGADIIIGTHTHSVQPHICHKGNHIFFSLGNFLFPDFYMMPPRPIFYPPEEDIQNIKTTYTYPYPITEPLKRVWKDNSRLGMVAEVEFGKEIIVKDRYLQLDENNILDFYNSKRLSIKLWIIGILVKMPFYYGGRIVMKALNVVKKIKGLVIK